MVFADQPLVGSRILVVEDEYVIATELERWLAQAGATVMGPVPTVQGALNLIDESAPDAALLDVNLGDGEMVYAVADRLAAIAVPYVFATGSIQVMDRSDYRSRPCLEKPVLNKDLLSTMTGLVTRRRGSMEPNAS